MTEPIPAGQVDPAKLRFHPAADLFPMLQGAEFDALVEDIRTNGLQHPILLDRDCQVVLDGRNRLRACPVAGREPRFERHIGDESPIDLIVTLNVRRRHMDESQRALVAARLVPQLKGYERSETCLNLGRFGRAARAASLLNASRSSVDRRPHRPPGPGVPLPPPGHAQRRLSGRRGGVSRVGPEQILDGRAEGWACDFIHRRFQPTPGSSSAYPPIQGRGLSIAVGRW